jgi:hypothetical protein
MGLGGEKFEAGGLAREGGDDIIGSFAGWDGHWVYVVGVIKCSAFCEEAIKVLKYK